MNKYKLIATDMDGTLLNNNHLISEENKKAIIDIQKKGVKFVLASGRPTYAMIHFAKDLEMHKYGGYLLAFNGGKIIELSKDKTIFEQSLTSEDVKTIYKESIDKKLSFLFYTEDTIYCNEFNKYTNEEITLTDMKGKIIEDINTLDINNIVKCMLLGNPDELLNSYKELQDKYKNKYVVNISKPYFMEFTLNGINKGNSLKNLCEKIGISTKETICIGDSDNDLSMLQISGLPVAVENARDELKEKSKFISTSNNDHALKTLIDKYF